MTDPYFWLLALVSIMNLGLWFSSSRAWKQIVESYDDLVVEQQRLIDELIEEGKQP
jgi:hypothetical protein